MYVPIVCVYFCARETERNSTSTTLFGNLLGEWLRSSTRIYQKLLLRPSIPWISSNEWLSSRFIDSSIFGSIGILTLFNDLQWDAVKQRKLEGRSGIDTRYLHAWTEKNLSLGRKPIPEGRQTRTQDPSEMNPDSWI